MNPAVLPAADQRAPGPDGTGPVPKPRLRPGRGPGRPALTTLPAGTELLEWRGPAGRTGAGQAELPLQWPAVAHRTVSTADVPRGATAPGPVVQQACVLIVDVLAGRRPAAQLQRLCAPSVRDAISRRSSRELGGPGRVRAGQLVSTRLETVSPAAVEACAVARLGDRFRAVALRLDLRRGRWQVTAVEIA